MSAGSSKAAKNRYPCCMKSLRSMAVAALVLLLAACGPAEPPGLPANTLERGLSSDPETLDFHKSRSTQALEVQRDLGEGLVGYSPTGELVPASAERWAPAIDFYKLHGAESMDEWTTFRLTADALERLAGDHR